MQAAESAFKDATGKHHSNVSIKRSDIVVEEYGPLEKQHLVRGKHPSTSSEHPGSRKQESQQAIKQNSHNNSQLISRRSDGKKQASVELPNDPRSSVQVIVIKIVDITDKRWKSSAFKVLSKLHGTNSVAANEEEGTLTVVGDLDPVVVVLALQKAKLNVQIVRTGLMNKPEGRKMPGRNPPEGQQKPESNPPQLPHSLITPYSPPYRPPPYRQHRHEVHQSREDPNSCVIQ